MNIALDYDDTFTRDPALWTNFVDDAKCMGHDIRFVTFRSNAYGGINDDILMDSIELDISILYTGGKRKRQYCYEQGFMVHVWIDDMPEIIVEDHYDAKIPQGLINKVLEEY